MSELKLRPPLSAFVRWSLAGGGPDEGDGDDAGRGGAVVPGVARAVLDDTFAGLEVNFGTGVQFKKHLTGKDHVEINGVRGVHAGVHGLENFGEAGEFGLEFRQGGKKRGGVGDGFGFRRNGEEAKAEAARGREIARVRRGRAV